jgi:lipopolysaccharide transport system ATP-binding protein
MRELAIRVEGLGKQYRIGGPQKPYHTLRESITEMAFGSLRRFRTLLRRGSQDGAARDAFWALKDVSFDVRRGEVVGIIGRNGAGKSTLLKVLSRITEPTEGGADIAGRVGSLLEVGTGFHPELTGRENVFLNGAILGMKRAEILRKFDEIVAFAEVERFIDTPVKRYSSGMYLRLAFAVAAHLEPEILIVDEVLAVGDSAFRNKCLGKMGAVASEGRTVLFVSHDMTSVSVLCNRVILLQGGRVQQMGPPGEVIATYIQQGTSARPAASWALDEAPGNQVVRIVGVTAGSRDDGDTDSFPLQGTIPLTVDFVVLTGGIRLNPVFIVKTVMGTTVFSTANYEDPEWAARTYPPGRYRACCVIPPHLFNDGQYVVDALIVQEMRAVPARAEVAVMFKVHDEGTTRGDYVGEWVGVVRPRCIWTAECVSRRNGEALNLGTAEQPRSLPSSTGVH